MFKKISPSKITTDLRKNFSAKKSNPSRGDTKYTIGVAKVTAVNYEEHLLSLRILQGEEGTFERTSVQIPYPGAGARKFLGAVPEVGDFCIIDHMALQSSGDNDFPIIVGWVIPGPWLGHDWLIEQPFAPEEFSFDKKNTTTVESFYQRTRHKLRHMLPGNVVASSSQGSDLVLDEGVLISNRRLNEIRLRDQDQALITRSLQQFHTMAGVRIYSGMVQRDARLVPTQMVSDGTNWTSKIWNFSENRPYTDGEIQSISPSSFFDNFLTPEQIFSHTDSLGNFLDSPQSGVFVPPNLDPYYILQRGLIINDEGLLIDPSSVSDAVYGGKSVYRISVDKNNNKHKNSVVDQSNSFTEYRLELNHTSDGVLPVTEQTDNFDAERLPTSAQSPGNRNNKEPFIKVVYGTVIGNDPFSTVGKDTYGVPLVPSIFNDAGKPSPKLENGLKIPVERHAATLFELRPPIGNNRKPTFFSFNKEGKLFFSIAGDNTSNSVEGFLEGGLKLVSNGKIDIDATQGINFKFKGGLDNNHGLDLNCDNAAVRIYGGGSSKTGTLSRITSPIGGGESLAPDVTIEGRNNVLLKSQKNLTIQTSEFSTDNTRVSLNALSGVTLNAGEKIGLNSKTYDLICNGKASQSFHGPKDLLPSNGAFRRTVFAGIGIGTVDEYLCVAGDREETFILGNHSTSIIAGNLNYSTELGIFTARATGNSLTIDGISGITASASVGNVTVSSLTGGVIVNGQTNVLVRSNGPTVISSLSNVTLAAPGKVGAIICNTDIDPLTGLPLVTFGMGSPGHLLGPSV